MVHNIHVWLNDKSLQVLLQSLLPQAACFMGLIANPPLSYSCEIFMKTEEKVWLLDVKDTKLGMAKCEEKLMFKKNGNKCHSSFKVAKP